MKYEPGYVSAPRRAPTPATITPSGAVQHDFSSGGDSVLLHFLQSSGSGVCRRRQVYVFKEDKEISEVMTIAAGPAEKVSLSDFKSLQKLFHRWTCDMIPLAGFVQAAFVLIGSVELGEILVIY